MGNRQLQLFPWDELAEQEKQKIFREIRNHYWFIRHTRPGGEARRLRHYRKVQANKKRLLLAGVEKREILDLLACCRGRCKKRPCQHF